ncbi:MAG: hypothetical protein KHZ60_03765 [Alistipes sp.]|jgi:hypothetical protein|uniref:hypothetical protein n=1 Tax=Alistipes sp. TaxID=1872444 RepID=UPI001D9469F6|nr:hypothetical protein [Alistipes sp.]MBS5019178.1 hypothetical protein [Alistipes sp.]
MKKLLVIAALAAVGMSACSKDDGVSASADGRKYVQVTIPENAASDETRTSVDGTTTSWVAGDRVAVSLYNGSTTEVCEFTADRSGATTTFSGDVPVGSYTLAAAHYPYNCGAAFDAVNKTFTHTWGDAYCSTDLAAYDFMFSTVCETPFVVDETTTVLPVALTFRPLMARIGMKLALGANETPKYVTFTTADNVLPTAGTVNADGTFSASARTNSLTVETDRKEFTVGLLPVGAASNMSVEVTTTDGMTYSDKSFQLAGLKRNTHYTMNVPCRTKRFMLTVPDGVDTKYGTDTYKDNEFYSVDPATDPTGIFKDWYFYRAELKNTTNTASGDKLKGKNRIQLQVALGFNNSNNGAFVTAPIQCDGTKKVTVSFTAATNTIIANPVEYRIGVTDNGADISENFLRSFDNIQSSQTGTCPWRYSGSVSRTHTFTVANGQRIMMKLYTTCGSTYHLELADFTYTVE